MLRDYQQRAIDQLYDWFRLGVGTNPCLVLPTGAGKSHIVAALCKDAIQSWPETRVLMLTHVKELIEQNAAKMREHWSNAPMGIYSASVGRRDIDQITFAGIQSVRNRADEIGHVDLVIIDEAHTINNNQSGSYRYLLDDLLLINPNLRVVGLTATPYRLGQGMLTDGDNALFDDLIEPIKIEELVERGYLSQLRSKKMHAQIDTSSVHRRGGEYVQSELEEEFEKVIEGAITEAILRAGDRKHWLFFCPGVDNAMHAAELLNEFEISAECLTGKATKKERAEVIHSFSTGQIKALTNCNILTTGFDYPDIDLIVMLRPTLSPALYVQMVGRGMRLKSHTDHCLILDFAGNIETHGPVTNVRPPRKSKGGESSDAPVKACPECDELVHLSVMECPECGHVWEKREKTYALRDSDVMGLDVFQHMEVTGWKWDKHRSRTSGKEMIKVKYYGGLTDPVVTEYFPVTHEGWAGQKAQERVASIANQSNCQIYNADTFEEMVSRLNAGTPPTIINFIKSGNFYEVKTRVWR